MRIHDGPCCLISTVDSGHIKVNDEILEELKMLTGELVVVAITGMYRTGKSYLMNKIMGRTCGR